MAATGSVPEWQEFFRSVGKPQDSFRDRALPRRMTAHGWEGEWRFVSVQNQTVRLNEPQNIDAILAPPPISQRKLYRSVIAGYTLNQSRAAQAWKATRLLS